MWNILTRDVKIGGIRACVWWLLMLAYGILCQMTVATPTFVRNQLYQKMQQKRTPSSKIKSTAGLPCPHVSVAELIRTSPVIVKALGAHIFANDNDEDIQRLQKWQNTQQQQQQQHNWWNDVSNLHTDSHSVKTTMFHNDYRQPIRLKRWTKTKTSKYRKRIIRKSIKNTKNRKKRSNTSSFMSLLPSMSIFNTIKEQSESLPIVDYNKIVKMQQKRTSFENVDTDLLSAAAEADRNKDPAYDFSYVYGNNNQKLFNNDKDHGLKSVDDSFAGDAILITLTPETIYRGTSLLKTTSLAGFESDSSFASISSSSSSRSSATGNEEDSVTGTTSDDISDTDNDDFSDVLETSDAAYLYNGQLNATVQPVSCFDANLFKMLPSELIVFGKLVNGEEEGKMKTERFPPLFQQTMNSRTDTLKISVNGLHRWTPHLEHYIWKHLGWDDWSDFTVCSVACGKGVQQRFRRCLLDNPRMTLNYNYNILNADNDDDDDDDDSIDANADESGPENGTETEVETERESDNNAYDSDYEMATEMDAVLINNQDDGNNDDINEEIITRSESPLMIQRSRKPSISSEDFDIEKDHQAFFDVEKSQKNKDFIKKEAKMLATITTSTSTSTSTTTMTNSFNKNNSFASLKEFLPLLENTTTTTTTSSQHVEVSGNNFHQQVELNTRTTANKELHKLLLLPNNKNRHMGPIGLKTPAEDFSRHHERGRSKQRRRHRLTKAYSTLFCEGYNVEQRNCNIFECSDDISDLLKFYRKPYVAEDNATPIINNHQYSSSYISLSSSQPIQQQPINAVEINDGINLDPTTPANMGYINFWFNSLNFTIMLTLRVKNDSVNGATLVSIRNFTHNLYLESCREGLRFYLERDQTTEMLPIKFQLNDYRWHQISISVQNGDFISVYVDCSWTNSFVVSRRLYSLPIRADVEIGRGFNGELQQLLILPGNQEQLQCSSKRTSINEVKRYIIDTFIDDYGI